MEKIFESLAGTAPGAVAVIIVVIIFLRHMQDRDVLIKELHTENEASRVESRNVISENTRALGAQAEILREVADSVKECQKIRAGWDHPK